MDKATVDLLLAYIDRHDIQILDLTGGAPEMNPHFRYLVAEARNRDVEVIDRCNLTILLEPGYEGLIDFLTEQQVTITASLPCYSEQNVEKQRGKGVYDSSIEALQALNERGYGSKSELQLNLVYNPVDTNLPPPQQQLELDYKRELMKRFGIVFNQLFVITNMPIARFGAVLMSHGNFEPYMQLLKDNYSDDNLSTVMCRSLLSVDWQGFVYDCDFNQMLELPLLASDKAKPHLSDLLSQSIDGNEIRIADHCFGCTAGQGSSCGGALDE
ncbi:MAG: radical SAM/Cys-rich protein [Oceanicoccus sp.]|jgi:radical SAM/Cys-rich protein